ncbi:MAG TPA: tyrosine-type recombinase/integrase [Chitinophagales bacterium]|nr:tyrosine-type recombinase/integrase [Chitinophagales bacterium]MBP6154790.1 tyrosine-type recombinase/integrase [Chitinophagales bacterium]HQV79183.1 tyrosine-type recombinase/integrase [Chitinophagales bacterium]HQW79861.1 tyrosine-type recombinase/integrase [Chitinophagales bacterium]
MENQIIYEFDKHNQQNVILIKFNYNKDLIEKFKKIKGIKWSYTKRAWYLIDNSINREKLGLEENVIGKNAFMYIHENNQIEYQKYIETLYLMGYSKNTIRTYTVEFAQLLVLIKNKPVSTLTTEQLKSYLLYCIQVLKLSANYIHSRMNAIKFYFEKVINQPKIVMEIPRPKKPLLLPKVISIEDIALMIQKTENLKHKTILMLVYGMGLRVSEITQLKINDIDSKRMQIHIRCAKGKKDRYVNLPEKVLPYLRDYYKIYQPKVYLFEGQAGEQYSIRSAQNVFQQSLRRANINKKIGIHGLRHSYATHLLEQGTDISYIQKLLGHNDIKTTLIYAHVSKKDINAIKSPLDRINEKL